MPAPEILDVIRIVASPASIAGLTTDGVPLQIAPDEVLVIGATTATADDPHAIQTLDDGHVGVEMTRSQIVEWCRRECEWELPDLDTFFVQGAAAGLPVKVWVDGDAALLITRTSLAHDLAERT